MQEMTIKIGLVSLGCPKNLVDSENMLGLVREHGFVITSDPAEADVIIVNTCGFIESAKEESVQEVLQMAEYKQTGSCRGLILAGCLGERYADDLLLEMPEVDAVMGSHAWSDIVTVIEKVLTGERFILKPQATVLADNQPRILTTAEHTAYLKIAEGCDNACSYCIIPQLRGSYKSRDLGSIVREAKTLAANGVKEIILVAQDVTRYGEDIGGQLLLPKLLLALCEIKELVWIRIMYAYPQYITDELIDTIASQDKICKYLDIPLQHANDKVLARMNRRDTRSSINILLAKLRSKVPGICLRTTFIVGFPGETEAEYQELKSFLLEQRFDRVGVFPYSQEEGTVAAEMPQIDDEVKQERYHELMALQAEISEQINIALEGKELPVLVDSVETTDNLTIATARSYREAPEIDGVIYLENAGKINTGALVKARILQGFTYDLAAESME